MLIAAAAAAANTNNTKNTAVSSAAAPVLSRSPSLQSTSAAASPQPQVLPSQNNPLCKLQAGKKSKCFIIRFLFLVS